MISEEAIIVYQKYYDQLKQLFISFIHENLNEESKQKVVSWEEIEEENKVMYISAFLELAKRKSLVADLLNIETLHDLIEQVIPPITQQEHDYLETNKKLLEIYNQNQKFVLPADGEPGLHFHEFIFLLGLIAITTCDSAASAPELIEDFFVEKLNFKAKAAMPADDEYDEEYDSEDEMDQQ